MMVMGAKRSGEVCDEGKKQDHGDSRRWRRELRVFASVTDEMLVMINVCPIRSFKEAQATRLYLIFSASAIPFFTSILPLAPWPVR